MKLHKIILAFDSFKGSASSLELAAAAKSAVLHYYPACQVVTLPIADGGEGTIEALRASMPSQEIMCEVADPLSRPIQGSYSITTGEHPIALMDIATASGLTLLPPAMRNPLLTSTYGTGQLISHAIKKGCKEFIIGLGGSATNDAGAGILSALGFIFRSREGTPFVPTGATLKDVESVYCPAELKDVKFTLICDVNNTFCGSNGAAAVYAPQKGADQVAVKKLDEGLLHFAEFVKVKCAIDLCSLSGAGAAGGAAGGMMAFLNATIKPGIDTILDYLHFEDILSDADLVMTGEGRIDAQTMMGKALEGIMMRSKAHQVPVIAFAGGIERVEMLNEMGFTAAFSIQQGPVSLEQATDTSNTLQNLERTVKQVMSVMHLSY